MIPIVLFWSKPFDSKHLAIVNFLCFSKSLLMPGSTVQPLYPKNTTYQSCEGASGNPVLVNGMGLEISYIIEIEIGWVFKNLTYFYKVGGCVKKKGQKYAYIIYEWSLGESDF